MTAFLNPWVILAFVLAVGAAAGGGYYKGNSDGKAEVQAEWDREKAAQYAEYAKAQEVARQREQDMQVAADKLRREKDAEIRNISARNTALANSLRERPSRSTQTGSLSGASGVGQGGCTGKELYREDGEFLVRIAREADELRAALKQCYNQYEAVR